MLGGEGPGPWVPARWPDLKDGLGVGVGVGLETGGSRNTLGPVGGCGADSLWLLF